MGRTDSKLPPNRKAGDLNHERYVYVMACLVGQNVTVQLKNNTRISGIFHSSMLAPFSTAQPNASGGDITVVLKCARELPSGDQLSGEIEDTIIIEGKDMVSLSAARCPLEFQEAPVRETGFRTDAEISSTNRCGHLTRELEPWEPSGDFPGGLQMGLEEKGSAATHTAWDQFEVNARRFQVKSTYQEELYTTPLDVTAIPQSVRDKADQIAREIEASQQGHGSDVEDDEEAMFGAVRGTGAYCSATPSNEPSQSAGTASTTPGLPTSQGTTTAAAGAPVAAPAARNATASEKEAAAKKLAAEQLWSRNSLARVLPGDPRFSKAAAAVALLPKSGKLPSRAPLIRGAHRPGNYYLFLGYVWCFALAVLALHTRMFNQSLVKNINALNLEPALPRLDEHGTDPLTKQSALAAKVARAKGVTGPLDRMQEKKNFLESLKTINARMDRIDWAAVAANRQRAAAERAKPEGDKTSEVLSGKDFRFNPNADAFTPSNERTSGETARKTGGQPGSPESRHSAVTAPSSGKADATKVTTVPRKFLPFEVTPMYREPIDRLLTEKILPKVLAEDPQSVHPAWNARISPNVPRPLHYGDILGPSVAASVPRGGVRPVLEGRQQQLQARPATGGNRLSQQQQQPPPQQQHPPPQQHLPQQQQQIQQHPQQAQQQQAQQHQQQQQAQQQQHQGLTTSGKLNSEVSMRQEFPRGSLASNGLPTGNQPRSLVGKETGTSNTPSQSVSAAGPATSYVAPEMHQQQQPAMVPFRGPFASAAFHPSTIGNNGNFFLVSKGVPGAPGGGLAFIEEGSQLQPVGIPQYGPGPHHYGLPVSGGPDANMLMGQLSPHVATASGADVSGGRPVAPGGHFVGMPGSANIVFIPPGTFLTGAVPGATTPPPNAAAAAGLYNASGMIPPQSMAGTHPVQWHLVTPPPSTPTTTGENVLGDNAKIVMMMDPQQQSHQGTPGTSSIIQAQQPYQTAQQQLMAAGGNNTAPPTPQYGYQIYQQQPAVSRQQQSQQLMQAAFAGQHIPAQYIGAPSGGAPAGMIASHLPPQVAYVTTGGGHIPGLPPQQQSYQKVPSYGTPSATLMAAPPPQNFSAKGPMMASGGHDGILPLNSGSPPLSPPSPRPREQHQSPGNNTSRKRKGTAGGGESHGNAAYVEGRST